MVAAYSGPAGASAVPRTGARATGTMAAGAPRSPSRARPRLPAARSTACARGGFRSSTTRATSASVFGVPIDPLRGDKVLGALEEAGLLARRPALRAAPGLARRTCCASTRPSTCRRCRSRRRSRGSSASRCRRARSRTTLDLQRLMAGGTIQATRLALRTGGIAVHLGGGFHHAHARRRPRLLRLQRRRGRDPPPARARLRGAGARGGPRPARRQRDAPRSSPTTRPSTPSRSTTTTGATRTRSPRRRSRSAPGVGRRPLTSRTLREALPPVFEAVRPGLVIYVAGTDPADDDAIGNWRVSARRACFERDRFVTSLARRDGRRLPDGGRARRRLRPPRLALHARATCSGSRRGARSSRPTEEALALKRFRRLGRDLRARGERRRRPALLAQRGGPRGPHARAPRARRASSATSRATASSCCSSGRASSPSCAPRASARCGSSSTRATRTARRCASSARTARGELLVELRARPQPQRRARHGGDRDRVAAAAEPARALLRRGGRGCPASSTRASACCATSWAGSWSCARPTGSTGSSSWPRTTTSPCRAGGSCGRCGRRTRRACAAMARALAGVPLPEATPRSRRAGSWTRPPASPLEWRPVPTVLPVSERLRALVTGPEYEEAVAARGRRASPSRRAAAGDGARAPALGSGSAVESGLRANSKEPLGCPRAAAPASPSSPRRPLPRRWPARPPRPSLARSRRRRAPAPRRRSSRSTRCGPTTSMRFRPLFTAGLKRLAEQGAVFTNARYRHACTETGPGHSVLLSGRSPRSSGIVGNTWYDRTLRAARQRRRATRRCASSAARAGPPRPPTSTASPSATC